MHAHTPSDGQLTFPALHAYIQRIGADQRNFRRYVIFEQVEGGYSRERYVVRLATDGTITVTAAGGGEVPAELLPTETEQADIKAGAVNFPKSIGALNADLLRDKLGITEGLYELWNRATNELIMCQQRVDLPNGGKAYLPWTFWSDGYWRRMEPDGDLPLWKPHPSRQMPRLMIHEGAKAAAFIDHLVNSPARRQELMDHPWGEELSKYEHWGWIGGAPNPGRTDWGEIKREGDSIRQVVFVADNDQGGVEAVAQISRILCRPLEMVVFDKRFPERFDLADPWPYDRNPQWRSPGGHYIGPGMADCLMNVTMATEVVHTGQEGRPAHKIRREFAAGWTWVSDPEVFIYNKQNDRLYPNTAFNRLVRPFSHVDNTGRLLLRLASSKADGLLYAPDEPAGLINREGRQLMNTYRPPHIKAVEGDPTPFLEYMKHLVPADDDRHELSRWCATLIARPAIRMTYGVLAISEVQGVGKGTLGEKILAPLVGLSNCSFPSEQEICDSSFNAWLVHKRLTVAHEIYAGQSKKAYNKLKSLMTDRKVTASLKYISNYTIDNWIHVFACSNSLEALKLDIFDRRWLVPGITTNKQPKEFWIRLHAWLDAGGLGIIRWWADEFLKDNEPVKTGEHAPMTDTKAEVIAASRSIGQQLVHDLATIWLEKIKADPANRIVLVMSDLHKVVAAERGLAPTDHRMEKLITLRKTMLATGWFEATTKDHRLKIKDRKEYVVANFPIGDSWPDIVGDHKEANDVLAM